MAVENDDDVYMAAALELATSAAAAGEVPVGAVIVLDGCIVGRGANAPIAMADPTAHAEVLALREAARNVGNYRLPGATAYVTLEPCPMCAGAFVHARIARLVYAAQDPRTGACGSVMNIVQDARLNHRVQVTPGVQADASAELLRTFFRSRR